MHLDLYFFLAKLVNQSVVRILKRFSHVLIILQPSLQELNLLRSYLWLSASLTLIKRAVPTKPSY